eukprot:CAMPEP_0116024614 /NCGR_PEP_ID=MMETSP0321-20121206/12438_1 /TAXON_ID=163516 /ORGANISM="Leptocylindrus danicus var. danicus, Strain B650" /LENGTH=270 /DNA_ID=CAMNT_0003496411 /DNA_START=290 /DNA_END=1102 /DNA_ORIENTATION=-
MPVALGGCSVVADAKYAYVIGGVNENFVPDLVLETLEWTIMAPMSRLRKNCAAVLRGKYIYVFGGFHEAWLVSVERYSIAENSWQDLSDMPRKHYCSHPSAVIFDKDIYIMGSLKVLDIFDTVSLMWKAGEDPSRKFPKSASAITAVALKNRFLVVICGWKGQIGSIRRSCYIYDRIFNFWAKMPAALNINFSRTGHTAAVLDGKIVVFGGSDNRYLSASSIEFIDVDNLLDCVPLTYPLPSFYFNRILILEKDGGNQGKAPKTKMCDDD